jgi:hypothetical protein
MPDSLDVIRRQVRDRMKELQPLVEEYRQLEKAIGALDAQQAQPTRNGRRGRRAGAASTASRGRRRGAGTRSAEALRLVTERPGITIPELAEAMGIKQNYLYRVMPSLAEEGKVSKSGRGWHLREGAASAES